MTYFRLSHEGFHVLGFVEDLCDRQQVEQVDLELLVKPLPLLSPPEADLLIGDEHDALGIVVFGARHVVEQLLLDGGRRLLSERK